MGLVQFRKTLIAWSSGERVPKKERRVVLLSFRECHGRRRGMDSSFVERGSLAK